MEGMDERDQPTRVDRRHCDLARSFWLPGAPGWQGGGDQLARRLEAPRERIDAWPAEVAPFGVLTYGLRISASRVRRNSVRSDRPRGRAPAAALGCRPGPDWGPACGNCGNCGNSSWTAPR